MVNWLKYFWGSFFLHKLSRESEKRSFLNAVLALALSFALFLAGLYAGYVVSFSTHINNSSQFFKTIEHVFSTNEVVLSVQDGIATSVGNARPIDTFSGVGLDPDTDMQVVVDTNPTMTNYAEFEAYCVLKSDREQHITYEEYLALKEEDRSKYACTVRNIGKPLLFDKQKIASYYEHLNNAQDELSPFYNKSIKEEYEALLKKDPESNPDFINKLYELYVASYYPFISGFEKYAAAPSMKTYYVQQLAKADRYLVILDDMCFGRFVADNGVEVEFSGFFAEIGEYLLDGNLQTDEQLREQSVKLVCSAFDQGKTNVMSVYVLNAISSFPIIVVAAFVVALVMWFVIKKCHGNFGLGAAVKTAFMYFLVASVLVFILCLGLSFALPRETVYAVAVAGLFFTVLARMTIFCVTECVRSLKRFREEQHAEQQV